MRTSADRPTAPAPSRHAAIFRFRSFPFGTTLSVRAATSAVSYLAEAFGRSLSRTAGASATQGATYAPRRCSSFCFATNSASLPQNRIDRRHLLFCSRRQGICEPGRAHKRQTAIEFKRTASAHGFTFQIVGSNTDGTVTIENINYHLEQGKPIEPAILDGAQQIFVNAGIGYRIPCNGKGGRVFTLRHRLAREYDHATGKSGFGINQSPPGQGLRAKNTPE